MLNGFPQAVDKEPFFTGIKVFVSVNMCRYEAFADTTGNGVLQD